jgi:hypothetical protein
LSVRNRGSEIDELEVCLRLCAAGHPYRVVDSAAVCKAVEAGLPNRADNVHKNLPSRCRHGLHRDR